MEENKKKDDMPVNAPEKNNSENIVEENREQTVQTAENKNTEADQTEDKRYRTLVNLEENLWTYGSPVIFRSGVLERDQISNKNRLTLNFTNIYPNNIKNVDVTIVASDDEGNAEELNHQYVALGQKYLACKGTTARLHIKNERARNFEIKVNSVEFEDGSYWVKRDAIYESAGEIEDIEAFAEAKAKDYEDNYISGSEAVAKDDSTEIGNGIEILKRITWYKDTSEILKDAKRKYKIVKQNEERKQASEDRRFKRRQAVKKRYMIAGVTVGVIILIAVISVVAFFIPNEKYKEAKKLLKNGETAKAAESFKKLNGFLKSEGYLAQCYYNIGLSALNEADEKKAAEYFKKSHDADEDSDYGVMAGAFLDYYAGTEALEKEDYESALKLFESSVNAASDFNLINKAGAAMAQVAYHQKQYEKAWNTIKNVYAKDTTYESQYGEYGYGYAKYLVDGGKTKEGMEIYNTISKFTKSANLNESVYKQAVKLGEQGKIDEAMKLLDTIKKSYKPANKLYEAMYAFNDKVQYWVGVWTHKGTVNGEKKTYKITISKVLYKGEMCLRIVDKNNDYLGFDTVISSKNRVTQILIGSYQLHFKLKKFHDQKFTYTLQEGNKMVRELKYDGQKYTTKYKKKVKK
ncbi:MAG: tetratricopeptide repeat protein [Eubacterium sp.]